MPDFQDQGPIVRIGGVRLPRWCYRVTDKGIDFTRLGFIVFRLLYWGCPFGAVTVDYSQGDD